MINKRALEKIHSYTEIGKDEGAKLLTGGEVATGQRPRQGLLLPADDLRRRRPADADRAGGDLRPDDGADPRARTSTRRSASSNGIKLRALVVDLHARREQGVPRDARPRRRGSRTSTPARSAPRCTCRSAARRTPATATARPARPRSTSSPSGSRSTSTTRASCRGRRSTTRRGAVAVTGARSSSSSFRAKALDAVREAALRGGRRTRSASTSTAPGTPQGHRRRSSAARATEPRRVGELGTRASASPSCDSRPCSRRTSTTR